MPPDLTTVDVVALAWFALIWLAYTVGQDRVWGRPVGVNQRMSGLRVNWVRAMLEREVRLMDGQLVGHTMNSVTFFASTSMLVLAGLVGLLGNVDRVYSVVSHLTFTVKTSQELFELKVLVLISIFIYAFFQFTWALRQYNYTCALIGTAPAPPVEARLRDSLAGTIATVMSHAVTSLNAGLRAYYFSLAAASWIIHPWLFLVSSNAVVAVLAWRQLWSGSARAIHRHLEILDGIERS